MSHPSVTSSVCGIGRQLEKGLIDPLIAAGNRYFAHSRAWKKILLS